VKSSRSFFSRRENCIFWWLINYIIRKLITIGYIKNFIEPSIRYSKIFVIITILLLHIYYYTAPDFLLHHFVFYRFYINLTLIRHRWFDLVCAAFISSAPVSFRGNNGCPQARVVAGENSTAVTAHAETNYRLCHWRQDPRSLWESACSAK